MIVLDRGAYPSQMTFDRTVANLSRDMPSARTSNGMAFFRDEEEREKCRELDSIVREDGFYIAYGDENDIESAEDA